MNNRKLWINAVINALQSELEVIRVDNLDTRTGTPEGALQDQLTRVLRTLDERMHSVHLATRERMNVKLAETLA